jgi:outer membrane protein assembly factor BamD (BamD/ComL family)
MFFKHILVLFIIIGVLGFLYGDRVFYFQANLMMNWQYDFPAYEAFERIVHYYPNSPYRTEAYKMMDLLPKRNGDLARYLANRQSDLKKRQDEQSKREAFR